MMAGGSQWSLRIFCCCSELRPKWHVKQLYWSHITTSASTMGFVLSMPADPTISTGNGSFSPSSSESGSAPSKPRLSRSLMTVYSTASTIAVGLVRVSVVYACMHMHVCMYLYACMYVCIYVSMYVCYIVFVPIRT